MSAESEITAWRWDRLLIDIAPLRASRSYRLLFCALSASLLVYGVLGMAVSWQIFSMAGSSLHVGLAGFFAGAGMVAGSFTGGALADRYDRRRLMLGSRIAFLAMVLLLLVNAMLASPILPVVYGAATAGGFIGGVSSPALLASVPSLIGREHLTAAAALAAMMAQIGAIVGPFIAGMLIAGPGLVFCYAVVALGVTLTPVLLWFLPPLPPLRTEPAPGLHAVAESWRFLKASPTVPALLMIDFAAFLFATPNVLTPQLGAQVFGDGPATVSLLYAAPAVGAFIAASSSGWTGRLRRTGGVLAMMVATWGAAIGLAGVAGDLTAMLLLFCLAGFCGTIAEILRGALLQRHTPDHLRGRVSSLWVIQASVGPALGGVQMGAVARLFSPAAALIFGGAACVASVGLICSAFPALRTSMLMDDEISPPRTPKRETS